MLVAVVVIAGGAAAIALSVHPQAAGGKPLHANAGPKLTPAQVAAQEAAATAAQANGVAAARWIAAQVDQAW